MPILDRIALAAALAACATAAAAEPLRIAASPQSAFVVRAINERLESRDARFDISTAHDTTQDIFRDFCVREADNGYDIVLVSREPTSAEVDRCEELDGSLNRFNMGFITLVLVQKATEEALDLTNAQIFEALAEKTPVAEEDFETNANRVWSDVNPNLPNTQIHALLPSDANATRATFNYEAMNVGCRHFKPIRKVFDAPRREDLCLRQRQDGTIEYFDDPLVALEKLRVAASGTIALVPFDDYQRNRDWLRAIPVDGYLPSPVNIVNEDYTLVNPVLIFVRNTALAKAPAQAWLMEALREETIGPGNYLIDFGFQILPTAMREDQRKWLSHLESE